MSKMVERVARAIWERRRERCKSTSGIELEEWGDGSIPRANHVFAEAKDAIKAMREPTREMVAAPKDANVDGISCMSWRAMIDAALSEKTA